MNNESIANAINLYNNIVSEALRCIARGEANAKIINY